MGLKVNKDFLVNQDYLVKQGKWENRVPQAETV